jgi:hypothetical protein
MPEIGLFQALQLVAEPVWLKLSIQISNIAN